jgi:PAS domain-containing protein
MAPKPSASCIDPRRGSSDRSIDSEALMDVTEQRRTDKQLRDSADKFRRLVESSPSMIYSSEPEIPGRTTYMSENIEEQLGYAASQFIETPDFWKSHVHALWRRSNRSEIEKVRELKHHASVQDFSRDRVASLVEDEVHVAERVVDDVEADV